MSQVEKHLEITSKSVVFLVVDNLANFLNEYPTSRVAITGYTDSSEPAAYNLKLSEMRAQAVTDYPISAGIEEARRTAAKRIAETLFPLHKTRFFDLPNPARNLLGFTSYVNEAFSYLCYFYSYLCFYCYFLSF